MVTEQETLCCEDDNIPQTDLYFNLISIRFATGFPEESYKWILKFIWRANIFKKVTIIRKGCIGVRFMKYNLESRITLIFTANEFYPKGTKTIK